jgi:hypothetical protein
MPTPPVPRELHIYYNDQDQTADVVVVFSLGSGHPATKLNGDAHLDYRHEHRDGGAAPSTDAIHVDLTFRDARQAATGRHRIRPATPDGVAA